MSELTTYIPDSAKEAGNSDSDSDFQSKIHKKVVCRSSHLSHASGSFNIFLGRLPVQKSSLYLKHDIYHRWRGRKYQINTNLYNTMSQWYQYRECQTKQYNQGEGKKDILFAFKAKLDQWVIIGTLANYNQYRCETWIDITKVCTIFINLLCCLYCFVVYYISYIILIHWQTD